jgi:hypothetical protein
LAHDDRPAVTTATALVAQLATCSAPIEGSRVTKVTSRSAEAHASVTEAVNWER